VQRHVRLIADHPAIVRLGRNVKQGATRELMNDAILHCNSCRRRVPIRDWSATVVRLDYSNGLESTLNCVWHGSQVRAFKACNVDPGRGGIHSNPEHGTACRRAKQGGTPAPPTPSTPAQVPASSAQNETTPTPTPPADVAASLTAPEVAPASTAVPPAPTADATVSRKDPEAPPPNFGKAEALMAAHKYAEAAKMFESFIAAGTANSKTRLYLGTCYQYLKHYDKALAQYDYVTNHASLISIKRQGQSAAHTLRCLRAGICPGQCLKPSDPGWHHMTVGGHPPTDIWMTFADGTSYSQNHMGHIIRMVNGHAVDQGACPICGGTGRVEPLK